MTNIISFPRTVFIIEVQDALSQSLKSLLESHERVVRIFSQAQEFWTENIHRDQDIVLLNFEHRKTSGFEFLNRLLNAKRRPQIVITSPRDLIFNDTDAFCGGRVTMLFHPVTPKRLVETIQSL
ncbi:MAG: response regulator [Acidimicrobiales bacterium]|nr:response regulator [Hyphomonadaceae bacterium]RZV43955.1 MAG: response regulator [Acidimicrobiales bacterium]